MSKVGSSLILLLLCPPLDECFPLKRRHCQFRKDAIVYATSGHGVLLVGPSLDAVKALKADLKGEQVTGQEEQPGRIELGPGDSVFIPAWTEIQAVNEGLEGDVGWVVVRAGSGDPVQVDLDGWGGQRLE